MSEIARPLTGVQVEARRRLPVRTDPYLIWSHEHGAWWGPGKHGYFAKVEQAGRYSWEEAIAICRNARRGANQRFGLYPELPVRLNDVLAVGGME